MDFPKSATGMWLYIATPCIYSAYSLVLKWNTHHFLSDHFTRGCYMAQWVDFALKTFFLFPKRKFYQPVVNDINHTHVFSFLAWYIYIYKCNERKFLLKTLHLEKKKIQTTQRIHCFVKIDTFLMLYFIIICDIIVPQEQLESGKPACEICFLRRVSSVISQSLFHLSVGSLVGPSSCCQSEQLSYLCPRPPNPPFPKCPVPFWRSIYSLQERLVTPGSWKWSSRCPACSPCWPSPLPVRTPSLCWQGRSRFQTRETQKLSIALIEHVIKLLEVDSLFSHLLHLRNGSHHVTRTSCSHACSCPDMFLFPW